jgi:hypothetical protein
MTLIIAATLASYAAGWLLAVPGAVPVLNAAAGWTIMVRELRAGRARRAIALMLVWAATMGATATTVRWAGWTLPDGRDWFLRSEYRDEMLHWVRTGIGPESEPAVFVPRHAASAAVFCVAAVATGGAAAMVMGAVLTNSMGDYVGSMAGLSAHPFASSVLGWHPWAVVRIVAFVILGVLLSGVTLSRVMRFEFRLRDWRVWALAAAAMLVLDVALKWVLAPAWGELLRGIAGW